jgi:hypothetical protein
MAMEVRAEVGEEADSGLAWEQVACLAICLEEGQWFCRPFTLSLLSSSSAAAEDGAAVEAVGDIDTALVEQVDQFL